MSDQPQARRRRHLMDPDNPRPVVRQDMSLSQVQKWVMSVLAVTTILHLVVGLVIAASVIEEDRVDARVGLLVIAAAFGVVAVAVGMMIHRRNPVSAWLGLGVLPAAVGSFFVF